MNETKAGTTPKIVVHNIKVHRDMSQETLCYLAVIEVNGVKAIAASNRGEGGPDNHDVHHTYGRPPTDKQRKAFDKAMGTLEAYAKTLPAHQYRDISIQPDAESLILDAVLAADELKKMRRMLKNHVVVRDNMGHVYSLKAAYEDRLIPAVMKSYQGGTILNGMPEDEALKLWMAEPSEE